MARVFSVKHVGKCFFFAPGVWLTSSRAVESHLSKWDHFFLTEAFTYFAARKSRECEIHTDSKFAMPPYTFSIIVYSIPTYL